MSEIDGMVKFSKSSKGDRKIVVEPKIGNPGEYAIPNDLFVEDWKDGSFIRAGESLTDGVPDPAELCQILGDKDTALYLLNEIQDSLWYIGAGSHDSDIEMIIHEMLRWIEIIDPEVNVLKNEYLMKRRKGFLRSKEKCLLLYLSS